MNTQLVISDNAALSQVWLAAHWEKKLTKNIIKNHSITESVEVIKSPQTQIRLRVSGYLLIGIIKLFYRKALLILTEVESLIEDVTTGKEKTKNANTKATSTDITMSTKKPKPLTYFENSLSSSSLLQSARSSVEIARNRASKDEITLKEIEYTPRYSRYSTGMKSVGELDITDNFLFDVASSMKFDDGMQLDTSMVGPDIDIEMNDFQMPQPVLDKPEENADKISLATPKITIKKRKKIEKVEKHRSMKKHWIDDKETIMTQEYDNLYQSEAEILKGHNMFTVKEYRLDAISLFQRSIIPDLPVELKEFYDGTGKFPVKKQEEQPVIYEPDDFDANQFNPSSPIEPLEENFQFNEQPIEEFEPIIPPSPPVVDTREDWSQRSAKMLALLKQNMKKNNMIGYNSLAKNKERKVVAGGFYELLIIANKGYIKLAQDRQFADLKIIKTEKFASANV